MASSYDVLIAGAGPAGSVCAILLARRGLRVLLVDGGVPQRRPAEVFAPATLRLVRQLNLPIPGCTPRGTPCRGVMSVWGTDEPEFYDYELYACGAGMTINRASYDAALLAAARSEGAETICDRVRSVSHAGTGWRAVTGSRLLEARMFVDACGRSAPIATRPSAGRSFRDKLVSVSMRHGTGLREDLLLLEAVEDGWWYASHHADTSTCLVYLSDADLVPRTASGRAEHLRQSFASTTLIRKCFATEPPFATHRVVDARTGRRPRVAEPLHFAVGDAAFSIDPLSGEGARLALESADAASSAILRSFEGDQQAHEGFQRWCDEAEHEQLAQRQRAYLSVHRKWHQGLFWRRRVDQGPRDVVATPPEDNRRHAPMPPSVTEDCT